MSELAKGHVKTEAALAGLAKAQIKTEAALAGLAEAQAQTTRQFQAYLRTRPKN